VHLVGFITKKFATMHGHMEVKKKMNRRLGVVFHKLNIYISYTVYKYVNMYHIL